jgi:transcriptional regulator with XRE-family HTH domain
MSNKIGQSPANARSAKKASRLGSFLKKFSDPTIRHNYLAQHIKTFLAAQIRSLRKDESQIEFGRRLGKPQSVVSRLEHGGTTVNVQTLVEIANKLELGLIIQFVNYNTFFEWSKNVSEETLTPRPFSLAGATLASMTPATFESSAQNVVKLHDWARLGSKPYASTISTKLPETLTMIGAA